MESVVILFNQCHCLSVIISDKAYLVCEQMKRQHDLLLSASCSKKTCVTKETSTSGVTNSASGSEVEGQHENQSVQCNNELESEIERQYDDFVLEKEEEPEGCDEDLKDLEKHPEGSVEEDDGLNSDISPPPSDDSAGESDLGSPDEATFAVACTIGSGTKIISSISSLARSCPSKWNRKGDEVYQAFKIDTYMTSTNYLLCMSRTDPATFTDINHDELKSPGLKGLPSWYVCILYTQ